MSIERIPPDEAATRLGDGWIYVDVRSVPEFEQGHPRGAYNVPLMHMQPGGRMAPNPQFAAVMKAAFAPDDAIVLGCRSGARSLRAAELLAAEGFARVVDMRGGFAGEVAPGGAVTCAGWQSRGLPVATAAEPGRSYAELSS